LAATLILHKNTSWLATLYEHAVKKYALILLLLLSLTMLTACTGQPSEGTIKSQIEHLIEMEGGKNIQFNVFQIQTVEPKSPEDRFNWQVSVKIAGTFNLHPYLDNKKYKFNTVRKYEFYRTGDGWASYVCSMTPLHLEMGSSEIKGENNETP
jgi:hypothetical protein